jgi:O-antigen/teichoic acid export membrane protein
LHPFINLIYKPFNDIGYVFLSNVLSSLVVFLFTAPLIFRCFEFKFDTKLWGKIFDYSWPLLLLGLAGMINETSDRIMLDWRLPFANEATRMEITGKYSACYKLSIFMTLAVQSFRYAAEPFFFAELKKDGAKLVYARVLKYFSYLAALIFLCVTLFLPVLIHIIGRNFRDAQQVVPILLMANLFLGLFIYLSQWYKQTGKTFYGAVISIGGAILTILINYYYIPQFSYMAAAWATFICYGFMALTTYFLGQKYYPVRYPVGRILLYIGSAVAIWLFGRWIMDVLYHGVWHTAMWVINAMLIALYLGLFLLVEKPNLTSVMNKVLNR